MTEREKVEAIMIKYNRNFSELQNKATVREIKTVFKYIGDESNRKAPEETISLLQELKETETDPEVLIEIANVLERLG